MDIGEIIFVSIMLIIFYAVIASAFSTHTPISKYDLDVETCEQARAQGWTEEEIEKFMNENNGHYCPDK
jgi:hypothetical protein